MRFAPVDYACVGQASGGLLQEEQSHILGRWCVPIPYCENFTPLRFLTECKRRELLLSQWLPVLTLTLIARSMRDACRTNPAQFAQEVFVRSQVVVEMKGSSGAMPGGADLRAV